MPATVAEPGRCQPWLARDAPTKVGSTGPRTCRRTRRMPPPQQRIHAQPACAGEDQRQQHRHEQHRQLEVAVALVADRIPHREVAQRVPLHRPVHGVGGHHGQHQQAGSGKTGTKTEQQAGCAEQFKPGGQLPVQGSGQLVERKRKASCRSANQFWPCSFSRPDSKYSQASSSRRPSGANQGRDGPAGHARWPGAGASSVHLRGGEGRCQAGAVKGPITPARRNCCSSAAPGSASACSARSCAAASCFR